MLHFIKNVLRKVLPQNSINILKALSLYIKGITFKLTLIRTNAKHKKALKQIKSKSKIRVVFFLIHHTAWKYEGVYRLMERDKRFDPIVLICPFITLGHDFMTKVMNQSFDTFKKNGYQVIKALDETTGIWLNVKEEINPEIVCFTNPWNITRPEYQIRNFLDTLTCYVPYGYETSHLHEAYYNGEMMNLVWKFFIENNIHKELSRKYSRNNSTNVVVTGYPGMDKFLIGGFSPRDVWKLKDKKFKRIIWAAHHTIPGLGASLDYSTFLDYSEVMLQFADQFKEDIQIAFKPHPKLRENLSKDEVWGKLKTDEYYQKWSELDNGQLEEGEYLDLFFTSDALIHDCGSFVVEYLYTGKPVLYLFRDDQITERFNEVGKMALSKFYSGKNNHDIEKFINEVVIGNRDSLKEERNYFFESVIKPPNNITASENIFKSIVSEISN